MNRVQRYKQRHDHSDYLFRFHLIMLPFSKMPFIFSRSIIWFSISQLNTTFNDFVTFNATFCTKVHFAKRAFRDILTITTLQNEVIMATIEEALARLSKSSFRAKFHLSDKDRKYISEKGLDTIRSHAHEFVRSRLSPSHIPNDGKQTPMRGHPVFIAQHACACCCRGCLNKWYKVRKDTSLNEAQQEKIVNLLMAWIEKQL